jgi:PKD repeat protein
MIFFYILLEAIKHSKFFYLKHQQMKMYKAKFCRKIISCLAVFILCCITNTTFAVYSWKQKANVGGIGRTGAGSFTINGKGYIGTGYDMAVNRKDFWEYDPVTDVWTQKADFGGVVRHGPASFAVGGKGYMGMGTITYPIYTFVSDWWEYDPTLNTWTQKGNFPGTARYLPITFVIGTKGYMGTGWNQASYFNDFWEYDPALDAWTQKANFGGGARISAVGFAVNGKGYAGTGNNGTNKSDFWEYDPVSNTWTAKANFPSPARYGVSAFVFNNEPYAGSGGNGTTFYTDFYKYDPLGNTWSPIASFIGAGRRHTGTFGIGQIGYVGTGSVTGGVTNTFYEYSPDNIPVSNFTANQNFCPGTCTDFTNLSANATSYQWYFPGGNPSISTDVNPTGICYAVPGSYDVTLICINANGSDSLTLQNYITVFPNPAPQGISQNGDTLFAYAGSLSYQWYYNGNIIPGATNYYCIGSGSGNYNVVTTDTNGCQVEAVIYDVVAATHEMVSISNLKTFVYPNPFFSSTTIHLTANESASNVKLEIFNLSVQRIEVLFDGKLNPGESKDVELNGNKMTEGIYFYRITSGGEVMNGRLVLIK